MPSKLLIIVNLWLDSLKRALRTAAEYKGVETVEKLFSKCSLLAFE